MRTTTFEQQLAAVGRILDERAGDLKEVCVAQSGDGFIVHGFELRFRREQSRYAPVTIQIEAEHLRAALIEAKHAVQGHRRWRR